jgi:hypothetical protein
MTITVQSGLETMEGNSHDIDISEIDLARSFVIVNATTTGTSATLPAEWSVSAYLSDTTTLRLQRDSSSIDATVAWQVITCDEDEFLVTQVNSLVTTGNTIRTHSIDEVDLSRTMLMYSCRTGATASNIAHATAEFTSPSTLVVTRGATDSARTYVRVEIVEWSLESGVTVVSDVSAVSGDLSSGTTVSHGATVTTDNTWLFAGCHHATAGLEQIALKVSFDSTNITIARHTTTNDYSSTVAWQLVTFPEDICYQYTETMGNLDTSVTETITSVTTGNSMLAGTNNCTGTGTSYGKQVLAIYFSDATTVTTDRSYSGQSTENFLSVVDFSSWNHSPNIMFLGQL